MKANTEKETIRTMQEIIDEVKNTYLDGNVFIAVNYKSDSYVDLINIANGEARFFTCHVRKQGSGKRNKANKVVRLRVANKMLIMEDSSIKEIAEEEMKKHTFVSVMPETLIHNKCVPVFHSALKSRVRFEYFFNITTSGVEVFKGDDTIEEEPAAPVPAEETAEVETTAPAPAETVPSEEDTVIEWLLNTHSKTENPITIKFIERMMNMSSYINKDMLKELDEFDWAYTYAQEICQDYIQSVKDIKNKLATAENIDRFILALSAISADLKAQAEKEEIAANNLKKSLENISENQVRFHYNGIDCNLSIIEQENDEKKKAEQKVSEIMANLSDVERDLLMKSLGLKPEVEIVEDQAAVKVPELSTADINGNKFVIIMSDGNTRSVEKDWKEIAHHLRQVALKKETVNVSVCEYVADKMKKGMSRKELGECLGSKHYAAKILDYCCQLGIYKIDQNLSPRKWSSAEAAAKGAKTRSTLSKIRQKAIDEDLARHAAERRRG